MNSNRSRIIAESLRCTLSFHILWYTTPVHYIPVVWHHQKKSIKNIVSKSDRLPVTKKRDSWFMSRAKGNGTKMCCFLCSLSSEEWSNIFLSFFRLNSPVYILLNFCYHAAHSYYIPIVAVWVPFFFQPVGSHIAQKHDDSATFAGDKNPSLVSELHYTVTLL